MLFDIEMMSINSTQQTIQTIQNGVDEEGKVRDQDQDQQAIRVRFLLRSVR